jgi:carbon storage regulator
MLILTRHKGESIMIDDDIEITVTEIKPNYVKLGFKYPETRRILRQEVYERIKEENKAASQNASEIKSLLRRKTS